MSTFLLSAYQQLGLILGITALFIAANAARPKRQIIPPVTSALVLNVRLSRQLIALANAGGLNPFDQPTVAALENIETRGPHASRKSKYMSNCAG
jgi:hypothetical protein